MSRADLLSKITQTYLAQVFPLASNPGACAKGQVPTPISVFEHVDQAGQIWRCLVYRNAHQDTSFKPSAKPGHYGVAVFYADNQSDPNTGWILLRKVGWNRGPGQWCGAWRAVHYADNRVTPFDGRAIDLDALRRARGDQAYIDRVDADVE